MILSGSSIKPFGSCSVPAWAIKDGQTKIVPPLAYTLNECIKQNIFLDCIKKGYSPIYKTGGPLDATNYRPISITSNFSKTFERALHQKITNHVQKFELLNPLQIDFWKGVSTADALLLFIESVLDSIDGNNFVQIALLVLAKAFDSLSHDILIEKIKLIGFNIDAQNIIKCFYSSRLQRDKLDSIYSNWMKVVRGVPQGTVLGTRLLFNLYVNDLSTAIDTDKITIQYADDCLVFA